MANLDLPAILTGVAADQAIVLSDIASLEALMADTHLSDDEHAAIQALLTTYSTWRHVLEGLQGRAQVLSDLGYPIFPSAELSAEMRAAILAALQAEIDVLSAEQAAIATLFGTPEIASGTIDFMEPIEKRG